MYNSSLDECDCNLGKIRELTARIRELEAEIQLSEVNGMCKDKRIRELEEAMKRMIGEHEPGSDCVATGPLTGTAMDYVCVLCEGKRILKK
jgi:hypothetical protein